MFTRTNDTSSRSLLARFRMRDEGSLSVEAVLVTPLLFTGLMISYGWFSAFRAKADATKAAFTLSDYISRQTNTVTPEFIDGMGALYAFLNNDGDTSLRVSAVRWSTAENQDGQYELVWSRGVGAFPDLSSVGEIEARLPLMSDGAEVVVVETERHWDAPFDMDLENFRFYDIAITSPRFATQVVYDSGDGSG